MAFRGLGYAQYEWRVFGQSLGSRAVFSLAKGPTTTALLSYSSIAYRVNHSITKS